MKLTRVVFLSLALTSLLVPSVQAQEPPDQPLPLANASSGNYQVPAPLTYAQQTARFEADQRVLRIQFNKWIGYDSLRPQMNASYLANGLRRYYIPSRALIASSGYTRAWYW